MRLDWTLLKRSVYPCAVAILLVVGAQGCSITAGPTAGVSQMPREPSSIQGRTGASAMKTQPETRLVSTGRASWYGPGFRGKRTASGEIFDDNKLTAAHKTLPLGTSAKVTNLSNGKSVTVEINDRGPFVDGRIIDLSQAAAHALGMVERGVAHVRIEPVIIDNRQIDNRQEVSSVD